MKVILTSTYGGKTTEGYYHQQVEGFHKRITSKRGHGHFYQVVRNHPQLFHTASNGSTGDYKRIAYAKGMVIHRKTPFIYNAKGSDC